MLTYHVHLHCPRDKINPELIIQTKPKFIANLEMRLPEGQQGAEQTLEPDAWTPDAWHLIEVFMKLDAFRKKILNFLNWVSKLIFNFCSLVLGFDSCHLVTFPFNEIPLTKTQFQKTALDIDFTLHWLGYSSLVTFCNSRNTVFWIFAVLVTPKHKFHSVWRSNVWYRNFKIHSG